MAQSFRARAVASVHNTAVIAGAFAVGAIAATSAFAAEASGALLASNLDPERAFAPACQTPAEVKPVLFPNQAVVFHDFRDQSAERLASVLDALIEQPVPAATLVRLALIPGKDQAMAFEFAANSCHTVTLALDLASMAAVFATAGVAAPFDSAQGRGSGAGA